MSDAGDYFRGGVFHDQLTDRRAGAEIRVTVVGVVAQTSDGQVFELQWSRIKLRLGGASNNMVFCRNHDQTLTIFCEQPGFYQALIDCGGPELRDGLEQARRDQHAAAAPMRRLAFLSAVLLLIALPLGYWGIMAGARSAVHAAPVSWDDQIGDLALANTDHPGPKVEDPQVLEPLQELFDRLLVPDGDSAFDFHLTVIDADITNAFALPGGQIVIYTGLLTAARHPDQVAGVLAHEIAHVTERHGMQGLARTVSVVVAIQLLTGDAGGLLALGTEVGRFAAENAYSRDQEAQSDRLAVERLHAVGINPIALADFFKDLKQAEPTVTIPTWTSTHPDHDDRIQAIRKQAAALPDSDYAPALSQQQWLAIRRALGLDGETEAQAEIGTEAEHEDSTAVTTEPELPYYVPQD